MRKRPSIVNMVQGAVLFAAGFFLLAGLFWRRRRRASIAAMACGAAEVLVPIISDMPLGAADAGI